MSISSSDLLRTAGSLPREIVSALQEPFLVLDGALRVVAASPPFFLCFGLEPDETVGMPVHGLGEGGWADAGLRELLESEARSQAVVEDHPLRLRTRSGETEPFLCTIRPIRSGANEIDLFLVGFRAARPARPASDQPSADALRRLADEHVTDVVALYRLDGTCLYAGSACEPVLGYQPTEMAERRPCDLVHPDDVGGLIRGFSDGRVPEAPSRLTLRVRRKSGDYLWLDTAVRVVRDAELGVVVHTSSRDVTQRKRAEEAVQWLSRHVKLILDTAAEGIFGIDMRGLITFINPAAAHALGYPVADLTGQPYRILLSPDAAHADDIGPALREGVARRSPAAAFARRDGTRVTVEYTCTPARQRGVVVGGVVTFRDITDQLRADAALRRAEWLAGVGQAVLTLRHEINNPLTTLLAEASLLEIGGNRPEEEREMISTIVDQARRIRDVVKRLTERQDGAASAADDSASIVELFDYPAGHRFDSD